MKNNKKNRRKFNSGLPGQMIGGAQSFGGLLQAAGAADDDINGLDYAGSMLSNAGNLAMAGSMFGPIGTAVGAAAGLGLGAYNMIQQEKEKNAVDFKNNTNNITSALSNMNMNSKYNAINRNKSNSTTVPGFKKGVPGGAVGNAMVSKEEGIRNPLNGDISVVPGVYNPSNPDTVSATLPAGASVYSADSSMKLPFGGSTPSDIAKKMSRFQKVASLRDKSNIDRRTNDINRKNIDKQSRLLDMHTAINNPQSMILADKGNFAGGNPGTVKYSYVSGNPDVLHYNGIPADDEKNVYSFIMPNSTALVNNDWRGAYNDYLNRGGKFSFSDFRYNTSIKNNNDGTMSVRLHNTGGKSPLIDDQLTSIAYNKYVKEPDRRTPGAVPTISAPTEAKPGNASTIEASSTTSNIDVNNSIIPESLVYPNPDSSVSMYEQENTSGNDYIIPESTVYPNATSGVEVYDFHKDKNGNTGGGDGKFGLNSNLFNSTGGLSDLASIAPSIYNLMSASPEVVKPRLSTPYIPNIRTNISKNIEDSRRQRQIARYNQRVVGGGNYLPFGINTYYSGIGALNEINSNAQNANNQYKMNSAQLLNQYNQYNNEELKRVDDINARNRAAARNMKSTGISQLSQFAQNKQLQNNQMQRDILNSNIWSLFTGRDIDPEQMKQITSMLFSNSGGK